MTVKTRAGKTPGIPAKQTTPEVVEVVISGMAPLKEICLSGHNFRKMFNETKLRELADNISAVGVLEPVLVRLDEKGRKILISGERRLRAAKLAKLTEIPYRQLDVTEEQALEIMAFENLHRDDLSPIDEAQAFKSLLTSGDYAVSALAARVNKSVAYVYRAVRLLELPDEILELIQTGVMTPAHGHQFLRVPAEARLAILEKVGANATVAGLSAHIDFTLSAPLSQVPFPTDKEFAGKPACTGCAHNSTNLSTLFDEGVEDGQCTDGACYASKLKQAQLDIANAEAERTGLKFVGTGTKKYDWSRNSAETIKGHVIVDEKLAKKVKRELAAYPEKFGIALNADNNTAVTVIIDKEYSDKVLGVQRTDSTGTGKPNYARDRAISEAAGNSRIQAVLDYITTDGNEMSVDAYIGEMASVLYEELDALIDDENTFALAVKKLGINLKNPTKEALLELPQGKLLALLWFKQFNWDIHRGENNLANWPHLDLMGIGNAAGKAAAEKFDTGNTKE